MADADDEDDEAYWHLYVPWAHEDGDLGLTPDSLRPEAAVAAAAAAAARPQGSGAVRLSFLLDFVTHRLPFGEPDMATWAVVHSIIQPATANTGGAYVALPEVADAAQPPSSPAPYYFVSHAWSRPLREAVALLAHHFRGHDPRGVWVWMDLFALRQEPYGGKGGPDLALVEAAVRHSGGVLLCLDELAVALRRTWCLYEAWLGAVAPPLPLDGRAPAPAAAAAAGAAGAGAAGGWAAGEQLPPVGVVALTPRALLPEERARLFSKIDVRESRCKYRTDRDALLAAARAGISNASTAGSAGAAGGLDAVSGVLRLALALGPQAPGPYPELHPGPSSSGSSSGLGGAAALAAGGAPGGRLALVPELWDMRVVDEWLALPQSDKRHQALVLYGPAASGKSVAAAAAAAHLARRHGLPVAAHFCSVSDVRSLCPIGLVVDLALQLSRLPAPLGPRLTRAYAALPPPLLADLLSANNGQAAVEAAVEALLVQPLQKLQQPDDDDEQDERDDEAAAEAAAARLGRGGVQADNDDVGRPGGGCDEDADEAEGGGGGGEGGGGGIAGARSMRMPAPRLAMPKAIILIIDGIDQADGAIVGGAAPYDNQVLQLIEEHLPKLPTFVRLLLTSRSLAYLVPRLAQRLTPAEAAPQALRPPGPFMRTIRLALAAADPSLTRRQRAATASGLVARAKGSLLHIKMALAYWELEREVAEAVAEEERRLAAAMAARKAAKAAGAGGHTTHGGGVTVSGGGGGGGAWSLSGGLGAGGVGVGGEAAGAGPSLERSSTNRSTASKWQLSLSELPSSLHSLFERYLGLRLRMLESSELRHRVAALLAVLAAAREPLTAVQAAAALAGGGGGGPGGLQPAVSLSGQPQGAMGPERVLSDLARRGLGVLVRLRTGPEAGRRPGHAATELLVLHSAVSEWLQAKPRVLLGGTVVVDVAAGHRALAAYCRDDSLGCLDRGRLAPHPYSARHLFLHVGLAALAASAPEPDSLSPISTVTATTARSSAAALRRRSSTNSAANAAAVALATALAAAAAAADWISTLELLLQRLDLWGAIYTAGAGAAARWVVMALAALPMCAIASADPACTDSVLLMLLAETRRWLLLHHDRLMWYPGAVIASAASMPDDCILRGRALEFSAGSDSATQQARGQTTAAGQTTASGGAAGAGGASAAAANAPITALMQLSSPVQLEGGGWGGAEASWGGGGDGAAGGGGGGGGAPCQADRHSLVLLSTGDRWSCCVQSLRTGPGRVLGVAMQPAGKLVATLHDDGRGVVLWDLWGGRPLMTMAHSQHLAPAGGGGGGSGRQSGAGASSSSGQAAAPARPSQLLFTPDGRKLLCAARTLMVWEVATGHLLYELHKPLPAAGGGRGGGAAAGSGRQRGGGARGSQGGGIGPGGVAAAAGGEVDVDGHVTAIALSPAGGRVAVGHVNGATRVWDVPSGQLLSSIPPPPHRRPVSALAFSLPLGATLCVAHGDGAGPDVPMRATAGAPVGEEELGNVPTALIKSDELTIHVWKVAAGSPKELEVLKGHTGRVNTLAFSTHDLNMITGSADETVRTWWDDPKTPQSDYRQLFILGGAGQGAVYALGFTPAPPPPPLPSPAANGSSSGGGGGGGKGRDAAAGEVTETPLLDFAAPSFASLAAAAIGGIITARDLDDSDNASVSTLTTNAGGAVGAGGVAGEGGGILGADPYGGGGGGIDEESKPNPDDLPLMAYSTGSGVIRLWSPKAQKQVGLLRGMDGPVHSLSFNADGRLLAAADSSDAGVVRVWDIGGVSVRDPADSTPSTGAGGLALKLPVEALALSPDGKRLAIVCADLTKECVRVVDVFSGKRLATMAPGGSAGGGHSGKVNAVAWSWDSSRLATGSDDLSVRVWYVSPPNPPPGNTLAAAAAIVESELLQQQQSGVVGSSSSSSKLRLLQGSSSGGGAAGDEGAATAGAEGADAAATAGGLPSKPGACQLVLTGHHRKVQCVSWAHSGRRLASGGYDQMVRIWDAASGEQLLLIYQLAWVAALAWAPDDSRLASGAGGKSVYMFNATTGKQLAAFNGNTHSLPAGAAAAAKPQTASGAAAAGAGGAAPAAAAPAEGGAAAAVEDDSTWMSSIRFNPDGTLLATRDCHGEVGLWDVAGPARLRPLRSLEGAWREAAFDPRAGDLLLFDFAATGALLTHAIGARSLPLGRCALRSVALSHPLLQFRGRSADTALGHNAAVLLSADNRAFFFVTGQHMAEQRRDAARAEREAIAAAASSGPPGREGGASATTSGGGGAGLSMSPSLVLGTRGADLQLPTR